MKQNQWKQRRRDWMLHASAKQQSRVFWLSLLALTVFIAGIALVLTLFGTIWGSGYKQNFATPDHWTMFAYDSYIRFDPRGMFNSCMSEPGECIALTPAQLADNIQKLAINEFGTDSFYVMIYDEDWNPVISSDSFEKILMDHGYDKDVCDPEHEGYKGHHDLMFCNEPVAYDASVLLEKNRAQETKRRPLPGWFAWFYQRADAMSWVETGILPETGQALIAQAQPHPYLQYRKAYREAGPEEQAQLEYAATRTSGYVQEARAGATLLTAWESVWLVPNTPAYPEYISYQDEWSKMKEYLEEHDPQSVSTSPLLNFYEFAGYQNKPEADTGARKEGAQLFHIVTTGAYSAAYDGALEVMYYFSATYLYLLAVYLLGVFALVFLLLRWRSRIETERANAHKNLMMQVAHELKTPMAVVRMRGDQLARNHPELRNDTETLREEIQKMSFRLSEVLTYSKLGEIKELDRTEFELGEMLEDLAADYYALAQDKGVALETELPQAPFMIHADQAQLRTAVSNYLSNAVKFTAEGGKITLRLIQTKKLARIEVRNTGSYIAPADLKRIWGEFASATGTDTAAKGTGLGLPIVRRITDLHHGRCGAESNAQETVFWLEIG